MAAAVLLVAAHQHVVGGLHEHHPRGDVASGQVVTHPVQVTGESAGTYVHHDGQLRDPGSRVQPEVNHPGDQLRRQVIGDVPAEVLEDLGGGTPPGTRQTSDQNDVDAGFICATLIVCLIQRFSLIRPVHPLARHPDARSAIRSCVAASDPAAPPRSASSTAVAVATTMPGTEVISSTVASLRRASNPKCATNALRRCSPKPGTASSADAVIRLDRLLRW